MNKSIIRKKNKTPKVKFGCNNCDDEDDDDKGTINGCV